MDNGLKPLFLHRDVDIHFAAEARNGTLYSYIVPVVYTVRTRDDHSA